jgi:hypothetical protein
MGMQVSVSWQWGPGWRIFVFRARPIFTARKSGYNSHQAQILFFSARNTLMFGSAVLDTAIGLVLLFFIVSTICSNIYTLISRALNTRGKMLKETLIKLLGEDLCEQLMHHPLIHENYVRYNFLTRKLEYQTEPAYIAPDVFARFLVELLDKASSTTDASKVLPDLPEQLTYPVRHFLLELQEKRRNLQNLQAEVEKWYNDRMDSLTRIFKERAQITLGIIAVFVVLIFNINTITIANTLWEGPTLREQLVQTANQTIQDSQAATPAAEEEIRGPVQIFEEDLQALHLPIGWTEQELKATKIVPGRLAFVDDPERRVPGTFINLVGWLVTIGAAMFGAPFWFDLLRNILNIRSGGAKK